MMQSEMSYGQGRKSVCSCFGSECFHPLGPHSTPSFLTTATRGRGSNGTGTSLGGADTPLSGSGWDLYCIMTSFSFLSRKQG